VTDHGFVQTCGRLRGRVDHRGRRCKPSETLEEEGRGQEAARLVELQMEYPRLRKLRQRQSLTEAPEFFCLALFHQGAEGHGSTGRLE